MRQFWSIKAVQSTMTRMGGLGLVVATGLMLAATPRIGPPSLWRRGPHECHARIYVRCRTPRDRP